MALQRELAVREPGRLHRLISETVGAINVVLICVWSLTQRPEWLYSYISEVFASVFILRRAGRL
jgi:hypothetical protein